MKITEETLIRFQKCETTPEEEVAILLVNGFHQKPDCPVKEGDIVALFPPVGGG